VPERNAAVRADREPGLDLQQVRPAVLRVPEAGLDVTLDGRGVGAEQADRGHVPVDAGHFDAELGDRPGSDRADDPVQPGGDCVEGPTDAIVVEDLGRQREHLFDRPGPCPVAHG